MRQGYASPEYLKSLRDFSEAFDHTRVDAFRARLRGRKNAECATSSTASEEEASPDGGAEAKAK